MMADQSATMAERIGSFELVSLLYIRRRQGELASRRSTATHPAGEGEGGYVPHPKLLCNLGLVNLT